MKNRFNPFSLFSLLILILSQDFFRLILMVKAESPSNSTSAEFSKAIVEWQKIKNETFTQAQTGDNFEVTLEDVLQVLKMQVKANETKILTEVLTHLKSLKLHQSTLLPTFFIALENNYDQVSHLFLKSYPNLLHWMIDQGPIHKKKYPSPHLEKLADGKLLEIAFQYGADANNEGHTFPLRHAAMANLWKYAEILVERGTTTNLKIEPNTALIEFLSKKNQTELAIKIVNAPQFLDHNHMQSIMGDAIEKKQNALMVAFFKRAPSLEVSFVTHLYIANKKVDSFFPVHAAVANDNLELLIEMKKLNFDLARLTEMGKSSPLSLAIKEKKPEILGQLIALGIDPRQDQTEIPLIILAVMKNNTEALTQLVSAGCDVNQVYIAHNLLDYCQTYKISPEMINLLIQKGARNSYFYERSFNFAISSFNFAINSPKVLMMAITVTVALQYILMNDKFGFEARLQAAYRHYRNPYSQRDLAMSGLIKSVLNEFYLNQVEVVAHSGVYNTVLPIKNISIADSDRIFEVNMEEAQSAIAQGFAMFGNNSFRVTLHNRTLSISLIDPKMQSVPKVKPTSIVLEIKSNLTKLVHESPQYKKMRQDEEVKALEQQYQQLRDQVTQILKKCSAELSTAQINFNALVTISDSAQTKLTALQAKYANFDWNGSKRLQKPLDSVEREINKFNPTLRTEYQKKLDGYILELKILQTEFSSKNTVDELSAIKTKLKKYSDLKLSHTFNSKEYETAVDQSLTQLTEGIERFIQDSNKSEKLNSVALTKEQKKAQRELELQRQQEEELRLQQENEEKKRLHRIQVEDQRRQLAIQRQLEAEKQERRRLAELKRQEELRAEQLKRAQSSSSSSSSSTSELNPVLKSKVITIGDLLQRVEDEKNMNDYMLIQYHYALLAQCLRLFEITDQFLKLPITNNIRNTLMHQHPYFHLAALRELGNLIAHLPNASSANSAPKFEDIIRDLQQCVTPQLIEKLRLCLFSLTLSNFHEVYVKKESVKPTTLQYLELIHSSIENLAKLDVKLELGLTVFPDKILAVQGILMCVGECFQQLIHLRKHELLLKNIDINFNNFLQYAKYTRDKMAHTVEDPQENEGLYIKFIRQSQGFSQQIVDLLHHYQDDNSDKISLSF